MTLFFFVLFCLFGGEGGEGIHSLQCIKDSLVFFFFFLMHRNLLIKIIPAHFPWNNLFYPQIKSLYIL